MSAVNNINRKFPCSLCNYNFTTKGNLTRHLKKNVCEKNVCEKNDRIIISNHHQDSSLEILSIKFKNTMVLSSLLFITNTSMAFIYGDYLYSLFFSYVTATSLLYHSNNKNNVYTNILDKIGICSIVTYGGYTLYMKSCTDNMFLVSSVVLLFVFVNYMYIYGYYTNQYCFDSQICTGNHYHSLLHIFTCIAHNIIIML